MLARFFFVALFLVAEGVSASESMTVLVDLRHQFDFDHLAKQWLHHLPSRQSQGASIRKALRDVAERSDRQWIPLLNKLRKHGVVDSWTRVTIVNRFIVTGRPAMVKILSRRSDVAAITEEIRGEGALEGESTATESASDWALASLHVASLRTMGMDGSGVVIGLIDSGASSQHEQLRDRFRGGASSWFDPLTGTKNPTDAQLGHGTAVLSCAVEVAPAAKWIAAVGLDKHLYNNVILTKAADWMLNVGRPDVLIIPWRLPQTACDRSLIRIVNAWRAAGIVVIFAAGNSGPESQSDVSPANYTNLFPGSGIALSVGAVDEHAGIYEHSSRGPNRCGTAVFPQIVAPGVDVAVAFPGGRSLYRRASGTSFAAGFAGGGIALLLQEFPNATVEEIEDAVRQTALDLGDAGPDSVYGFGAMNIPRAVEWLRSRHNSERMPLPRPN